MTGPEATPGHGRSVLLVDDDELLQELMALYLSRNGFRVLLAGNGREALALLDRGPVDIIILDLLMPEMDGMQFLYHLRQERGLETPLLVLTAYNQPGFEAEVLAAGADRVGFKPVDQHRLLQLLSDL